MQFLIFFFMAIGLSMDAFSLALAYGVNNISLRKIIFCSISVGIFHFIMPYIGASIGNLIISIIPIKIDLVVSLIFFLLALEMFLSRNNEVNNIINSISSIIFFSFTVSIDSFSVGIALGITKSMIIQAGIIFSIVSSIFTLLGLMLGKKLFLKYGKKAIYLGVILLVFLGVKYLL